MLLSALRMTGAAAIGALAVFAGYAALTGEEPMGAAAEAEAALSVFMAQPDAEAERQLRGLPETQMTANPVTADKQDDGKFFTTNPRHADKVDDGKFFTTNAKRIDKKDDGDFFSVNTVADRFDPCLKADGTPYQGPGTALNPFAPTSPCLPKATAESYAEVTPEVTPEPERTFEVYLPHRRDYFAPEPPARGGSDYRTI